MFTWNNGWKFCIFHCKSINKFFSGELSSAFLTIVYSTEYVILPKVEKVSIDNDNFSTYFKVDNGWIFDEDSKKLGTNFLVHNNLRKFCDAWFKVDFAYEEQTFTKTFCLNKSDLIYYPYKYFTFDIEGEFDRNKASYNVTIIKNGYLYN